MVNLETYFDENERAGIEAAVERAEVKTRAEIVPILTDACDRYDRAEDLFGVFFAGLLVSLFWVLFQEVDTQSAWASVQNPELTFSLPWVLGTALTGFLLGAALATRFWFLRRCFTNAKERETAVFAAAERAFLIHRVSETKDSSGIVILVSVFEQAVAVYAGTALKEFLSEAQVQEVRDRVVQGFAKGQGAQGLVEAIDFLGEELAKGAPASQENPNQLSNQLVIWPQNL